MLQFGRLFHYFSALDTLHECNRINLNSSGKSKAALGGWYKTNIFRTFYHLSFDWNNKDIFRSEIFDLNSQDLRYFYLCKTRHKNESYWGV